MVEGNGKALVVDDDFVNAELLADYLQSRGYEIETANDGYEAIEALSARVPDVVLLDIMMPKMDGFETCMRIKSNRETSALPVLMITALDGAEDRKRAIAAGADDFITKPFDFSEVSLRIRNAVRMRRQFVAAQESYVRLRALEELRDTLSHSILHDVRSPLSGALTLVTSLNKSLAESMSDSQGLMMGRVQYSMRMTLELLNSVLDVAKIETAEFPLNYEKSDIKKVVEQALDMTGSHGQDTTIEVSAPDLEVAAECDQTILVRVIVNLIDNALKHTQTAGKISISLSSNEHEVEVRVADNGPGISEEMQTVIFQKFASAVSSANPTRHSPGLGLAFCKLAIEAHQGQIGVESEQGNGSEFWVRLPVLRPESPARAA